MLKSTFLLLAVTLAALASANVEMYEPPHRGQPGAIGYSDAQKNVNHASQNPLNSKDTPRPFPCQGYAKGPIQRRIASGSNIPTRIRGLSSQGGGHCQFSLSYDGGVTFVTISTILDTCLTGAKDTSSYFFSILLPKGAPTGDAIYAFTYYNAAGPREIYQNCADISITGSSSTSITGKELLIAQLDGHPKIPDFSRNRALNGKALFDARRDITVFANRSVKYGPRPASLPVSRSQPTIAPRPVARAPIAPMIAPPVASSAVLPGVPEPVAPIPEVTAPTIPLAITDSIASLLDDTFIPSAPSRKANIQYSGSNPDEAIRFINGASSTSSPAYLVPLMSLIVAPLLLL